MNMDYISCPHTPGDRENKSAIVFHNNLDIRGKDVIIIDDAIESGGTMLRLVEYLQQDFAGIFGRGNTFRQARKSANSRQTVLFP